MVENSGERHSLFLATGQHVLPVSGRVPAAFPLHQMRQVHSGKTRFQVLFGDTFGLHVIQCIRVDDLFFQAADRHVRSAGKNGKKLSQKILIKHHHRFISSPSFVSLFSSFKSHVKLIQNK